MRTRKVVAVWAALALLLAGLSLRPARADDTGGDVPMFRGNPAHTGVMPGPGPDPSGKIGELWQCECYPMPAAVAIVGDTVYIGGLFSTLAVDVTSGVERWHFDKGGPTFTTPAVAGGSVFVADEEGFVYALAASTGGEQWRFAADNVIRSSPTVVDGIVYVGSGNGSISDIGTVYALDAAAGAEHWRFNLGEGGSVDSSPTVADGLVYVGSVDDNLYALDAATGIERWHFTTGASILSSPTIANGTVYASSDDGYLYALDAASGTERWRFAAISGDSTFWPAVSDGIVYIGSEDGTFFALDATSGTEKWRFAASETSRINWPVIAAGVVYIGSEDGSVYALNAASGAERWHYTLSVGGLDSMVVTGRAIYVTVSDHYLYTLGNVTGGSLATVAAEQTQITFDQQAAAESEQAASEQATADAQESSDQQWANYFDKFGGLLSTSGNVPAGFTFGNSAPIQTPDSSDPTSPSGWLRAERYLIDVPGEGDSGGIALFAYETPDAAATAYDAVATGLLRGGWRHAEGTDGIGHAHHCFSIMQSDGSTGICYIRRDRMIIATGSFLPLDAADAVLMNAVDLAIYADGIYDQIPPPA